MSRPRLPQRASKLFLLIAFLQIPLSAALPPPIQHVETITVPCDETSRPGRPTFTVHQIGDGQIQAPHSFGQPEPTTSTTLTTRTTIFSTIFATTTVTPTQVVETSVAAVETSSVVAVSSTQSAQASPSVIATSVAAASSAVVESSSSAPSLSSVAVSPASVFSTSSSITITSSSSAESSSIAISTASVLSSTSSVTVASSSSAASSSSTAISTASAFSTSSSAAVTSSTSAQSSSIVVSTTSSLGTSSSTAITSTSSDQSSSSTASTTSVLSTSSSVAAVSSVTSESSIAVSPASASSSSSSPQTSTQQSSTTSSSQSTSSSSVAVTSPSSNAARFTTSEVVSSSSSLSSSSSAYVSSSIASTSSPISSEVQASVIVSTSRPDTSLTVLTTSAVQSATLPVPTNLSGTIVTSLDTTGQVSANPFPTSISITLTSLSLIDTRTVSVRPTATANVTSIDVGNIFRPIATDAPPAQISQRSDHPVPRLGIQSQQRKLSTNKFYSNLFLGDQSAPAYTFPYSVSWGKGGGQSGSWGLAVSHTERSQLAHGEIEPVTGAWRYYTNEIGIQSIVLSATQLTNDTALTTDSLQGSSVNANLVPKGAQNPAITFPLVQGMAFTTAIYHGVTPVISSGVGIKNLTYSGAVQYSVAHKYRILLANGFTWLIYVIPQDSNYGVNQFTLLSPNSAQGPSGFNGYIQVAKIPANDTSSEFLYDSAAGVYPTAANVSGSVNGTAGTYTLSWTKQGDTSKNLLMFALPHHVQSLSSQTNGSLTDLHLITGSKGLSTAIHADSWTLTEADLPVSMDFAPWEAGQGSIKNVSSYAQSLINKAGTSELAQDMSAQSNLNSMYFSGKALAKFAAITYAVHDMADNVTLALTGLKQLKSAFAVFVNNQQIYPLVYESAWGGAVSIGSYSTGDAGLDFGNTYYNDHHFHYGYFVYAAAVIAYLDPAWLANGTNKAWVNMLVRDYANPVDSDPYFPFSRSFDWYHGHSWAKGLFASADGKDQESSSEDTMASYAIKMWGRISGDSAMEARGNLMLAVQARTLDNYYLMTSNNTVQPAQFIGNKAAGILFENKIDHTTYFGTNIEYIEGIHMLPLMPFSSLTRRKQFVREEWNTYFANTVNQVQGGWRGILMSNLALIEPVTSFNFFSNSTGTLNPSLLDGGTSQTWNLAFSAALGGSPAASTKRSVEQEAIPETVPDSSVTEYKVGDQVSEVSKVSLLGVSARSDARRERYARRAVMAIRR